MNKHSKKFMVRRSRMPWYRMGGIPAANCVAAYKAVGAADIATSYVNLANPGTYDLTAPVAAPTFDTADGWTFNGTTQFLMTGITPADARIWTMIIRTSGVSGDTGWAIGYNLNSAKNFCITPRRSTSNRRYFNGGTTLNVSGAITGGVQAIAGATAYLNGASEGTITLAASSGAIDIGAAWNDAAPPTPLYYFAGKVQAVAIYNVAITEAQVAAVTTAMTAAGF